MGNGNDAVLRVGIEVTNEQALDRVARATQFVGETTKVTAQDLSMFNQIFQQSVESGVRWERALKDIAASSKTAGAAVSGIARDVRELIGEQDKATISTQRMGRMMEQAYAENARRAKQSMQEQVAAHRAALTEMKAFAGAAGLGLPGIPTGLAGSSLGGSLVPVAATAGLILAGRAIYDLVKDAAEGARELSNFASRLGLTVDQAQRLSIAAKLTGVGISALEQSARSLSAVLEDPSGAGKKQLQALNDLHISTVTYSGAQKELGAITLEVLDHLSEIPNVAERVHDAQLLLGRGAKVLEPMIADLPVLTKLADDFAKQIHSGANEQLAGTDRKIKEVSESWDVFKKNIGEVLAPVVVEVLWAFTPRHIGGGGMTDDSSGHDAGRVDLSGTYIAPGMDPKMAASIARGQALARRARGQFGNDTKDGLEAQLADERAGINKAQSTINQAALKDSQIGEEAVTKAIADRTEHLKKELEIRQKIKALDQKDNLPGMMEHFADADVSPERRLANQYSKDLSDLSNPTAARRAQLSGYGPGGYGAAYGRQLQSRMDKEGHIATKQELEQELRAIGINSSLTAADDRGASKNIPDFITDSISGSFGGPPGGSYAQRAKALQQTMQYQTQKAGLSVGPGGDSAGAALERELQIRTQIVELERQSDLEHTNSITNEAEKKKAIADADYAAAEKLARIQEENEIHLLELAKQRKEEFASIFAQGAMALQKGPSAFRNFIVGQSQDLESTVLKNVGGMMYDHAGGGGEQPFGLPSSVVGTTGSPTMIGKLLTGSKMFGPGPGAGNVAPQIVSIDANVLTSTQYLGAIAQALGVSGGPTIPGGASFVMPVGAGGGVFGLGGGGFGGGGSGIPATWGGFVGPIDNSDPANAINLANSGFAIPGSIGSSSFSSSTIASAMTGMAKGLSGFSTGAASVVSGRGFETMLGQGATNADGSVNSVSTAQQAGAGIGLAGATYVGISTAMKDFSKGGAQGIIGGIGAVAGTAAAWDPEPISHSILAGVALASQVVSSLFGDPKAARQAQLNHELTNAAYSDQGHFDSKGNYVAGSQPAPIAYFGSSGGDSYDYNAQGGVRTGSAAATSRNTFAPSGSNQIGYAPPGLVPKGWNPGAPGGGGGGTTIVVQAMDSKSFLDHASDIGDAVRKAVQGGHPLVSELQNTLMPR